MQKREKSTHKLVARIDQVLVIVLLMLIRDALLASGLIAGLAVVAQQFIAVHRAGELFLKTVAAAVQTAVGQAVVDLVELLEYANARVVIV